MDDIHIEREHQLGLAKARRLAEVWAEKAEKKFDMQCTIVRGDSSDTVAFKRSGVSGSLLVEAARFKLDAKLGFLMGAFSKSIEAEITKNLDALLEQNAVPSVAPSAAEPAPRHAAAAKKPVKKGVR